MHPPPPRGGLASTKGRKGLETQETEVPLIQQAQALWGRGLGASGGGGPASSHGAAGGGGPASSQGAAAQAAPSLWAAYRPTTRQQEPSHFALHGASAASAPPPSPFEGMTGESKGKGYAGKGYGKWADVPGHQPTETRPGMPISNRGCSTGPERGSRVLRLRIQAGSAPVLRTTNREHT